MTSDKELLMGISTGDRVVIHSLDKTEPEYQANSTMRKMIGKDFEVEKALITSGRPKLRIRSPGGRTYVFHPEDLELIRLDLINSEAMPQEKIMFDPKELR